MSMEVSETTEERRALEWEAFRNVTNRLIEVIDASAVEPIKRRHALEGNRLFWSVLKENLFNEENKLTSELKGQILSLAFWVEGYTESVLSGELREVRPLISVNHVIMEGLA